MTTTINAVAENEFTQELIAKNFMSVAKALESVEEWMYLTEGRLGALERLGDKAVKATKGRKRKYVIVFVAGAYVGRKLQDRATREKLKHMSDKLAEKTAAKVDAVLYGDKKHDEQPSKDAATWTRTRQPDPSVDVSPEKTLPN